MDILAPKGSTSLSDVMDPDRYFAFLHEYFTEMSEPILETSAEIYSIRRR